MKQIITYEQLLESGLDAKEIVRKFKLEELVIYPNSTEKSLKEELVEYITIGKLMEYIEDFFVKNVKVKPSFWVVTDYTGKSFSKHELIDALWESTLNILKLRSGFFKKMKAKKNKEKQMKLF